MDRVLLSIAKRTPTEKEAGLPMGKHFMLVIEYLCNKIRQCQKH